MIDNSGGTMGLQKSGIPEAPADTDTVHTRICGGLDIHI